MLSVITDFSQNVLIVTVFVFVIILMVRRDMKDENKPRVVEIDSEETKSVREVVYFESMYVDEKFKQIAVELEKIDKLIPCENKLNDLHTALIDVQKLQRTFDKTYEIEQVELDNAASWLQKPVFTRGKYKPTPYDADEIGSISIRDVDKTVRKMTTDEPSDSDSDVNDVDGKPDTKSVDISSKVLFEIPNVRLENVLDVANFMNRLWLLADVWSRILFHNLLESVKIWFVVFMTVRRSMFTVKIFEHALNSVTIFLKTFITIQTRVIKRDDLSIITFVLFPETRESRTTRLYNFFLQIIAKIKSIFQ